MTVKHWSLTTLREKLIKIGAKVTHHAKYVTFQMAEVAVPRNVVRGDSGSDRVGCEQARWPSEGGLAMMQAVS